MSTPFIEVPEVAPPEPPASQPGAPPRPARSAPSYAPQSLILIVDDEANGRTLLQGILQHEPYRLVLAANGTEAMELALKHRPDVVLLDVMMPQISGFTVCQQLRRHAQLRHVPILLLTALDDRASKLRGLAAGADDFLTRPIDPTELKTRLRTITRLNRFRRMFEERARYEHLVEMAPNGIAVVDRDFRILECNASFRRIAGCDPTGLPFRSLLPEERARALAAHVAAIEGPSEGATAFETPLPGAARPDIVVEIIAGRVEWQGESLCQLIVRDITEKKSLEAQLLRSQRIELLGQLAGGIVHDVNNLLAAVYGMTELLERDAAPGSQPRLSLMKSTMQRIIALLRQLLMFARGSDGVPGPVSPAQILEEVAGVVRSTFGGDFEVASDTASDTGEIVADGNQLHQVLMNLCVNARDAMPSGGRLTLRGRRETLAPEQAAKLGPDAKPGPYVVLGVSDSGTGIPPEVKARLFDPFFTTKAPGKGTGLGLATVLRVVRRHGGFVALQTEVGRGTTFDCYFPASIPVPIRPGA
jgi:PAS domain S-box-containing protein